MTTTEKIDLLVTLQTGHPADINPLLPTQHYLQAKFDSYVTEACECREQSIDKKDLSEQELREIAYNFLQDNEIETEA